MKLEFEKRNCRYLEHAIRDSRREEQTQEIRLGDGMPDIGRVIGAWGQIILRGKEWRGDAVVVSGGVMCWVLYEPEDGTQPRCIDTWIPFKMKWELPEDTREGDIRVSCILRSVDGRNVSPRKIMTRAVISARMEALTPGEASVYIPGQNMDGVELLKGSYPMRLPREAGEKTFLVDEVLSVSDTGPVPEKLLCSRVEPRIMECRVLTDKVVFRGNCNLRILGQTPEGRLHIWDFDLPFSQIAQLRDEYGPEAGGSMVMGVTSLEPELDDQGGLRVKCGLVGQYLVDEREMVEIVEDAYSPGRELEVWTEPLALPAILENRVEKVSMTQKLPADSEDVVDVAFRGDHPQCRRMDDGVSMELSGQFQVLSYGANQELMMSSAHGEEELSIPADEEAIVDGRTLPADNIRFSSKDGGLELSAEIPLELVTTGRQGLTQVTGLQFGEETAQDPARPSLILRRADGQSLWQIAKDCGSTVGAIRQANDLREEPEQGRMLLIPVS